MPCLVISFLFFLFFTLLLMLYLCVLYIFIFFFVYLMVNKVDYHPLYHNVNIIDLGLIWLCWPDHLRSIGHLRTEIT